MKIILLLEEVIHQIVYLHPKLIQVNKKIQNK
jgi:hypothetical protein